MAVGHLLLQSLRPMSDLSVDDAGLHFFLVIQNRLRKRTGISAADQDVSG